MNRQSLLVRSILMDGAALFLAFTSIACGEPASAVEVPAGPDYEDLFACNVALACPMYCAHLGIEECMGGANAPTCAGELWLAGTAGALMLQDRPGPGTWAGDILTILPGDGKAFVQKREKTCPDIGLGCNLENVPWVLGPQELCDVQMPPANCMPGDCPQMPSVENCVAVEIEWNCDDAKAAVTPKP